LRNTDVVGLKAYDLARAGHGLNGPPVVVTLPVGIGDIVAIAPTPRLGRVDARTECDRLGRGDDLRIGSAKGTIEEARLARLRHESVVLCYLNGHNRWICFPSSMSAWRGLCQGDKRFQNRTLAPLGVNWPLKLTHLF